MKTRLLRSLTLAILFAPFGACSSGIDRCRLSPAQARVAALSVEKISGRGGRIASARLQAFGEKVYVSGTVRRQPSGEPSPGAHVDVVILNAERKVSARFAINYQPRSLRESSREFAPARFTVRLAELPNPGDTVQVSFHDLSKAECTFARDSSPRLGGP